MPILPLQAHKWWWWGGGRGGEGGRGGGRGKRDVWMNGWLYG